MHTGMTVCVVFSMISNVNPTETNTFQQVIEGEELDTMLEQTYIAVYHLKMSVTLI